ncbi:MAG: hypothetical protein KAG18_06425, partial [Sinobacterium sp.]|nr:hypothetical protein [Sinobacterium sp.]
ENDEHIYLQGTLQASTPYLDCGEVICLSRVSSDGVYSHELAVIKELNLSNLHQPQIVAQKITADIVGLCSTQGFKPVHGREAMEKYPVLENGLIGNKDGESFLLTSTANHLVSDALLRITLPDDKSFIIKTHQLHFISPATMLFSLA